MSEAIPDRLHEGDWRVETFDDDGRCLIASFTGPAAENRAKSYRLWLDYHPVGGLPRSVSPQPAFEDCPSASDIARWFKEEMRGVGNVGGDAWWLSRNPHGSCRMLAFVDLDTQEHYLLDIAIGDTRNLLWVTCGMDGLWADWWQHPVSSTDRDPYWDRDGLAWLADNIVWFIENPMGGGAGTPAERTDSDA
jgi:hypothetical protein